MAEKRERFIVIDEGLDFMVRDTVTGDDLIDADGVCDVLNDYEKENEQLKHKVNCLQDRLDDYVMVEKENEQLKSKLTDCNEAVWSWSKSYNRVYEENEQLKLELGKLNILYKAKCKTEEQLLERGKEVEKENEQLKTQLQNTSDQRNEFHRGARENANRVGKLEKENEQLKQDIGELQNDKLLTELQMKCDKKQEHIVVLENKIMRMREAIHKLEWLASHRNADLKRENEQLKQFKEDVFNKIDMHLRMLPTARDNEFNEDDGDPSLYVGAIYMLETLKKELKE